VGLAGGEGDSKIEIKDMIESEGYFNEAETSEIEATFDKTIDEDFYKACFRGSSPTNVL
jgi:hypothetical protein